MAAFLCHQAVEKALKALIMGKTRNPPPLTHSLIVLGRLAQVPKEYQRLLRELTAEYVMSRYPNAAEEVPAKLYEPEVVQEYLEKTDEVLEWVRKELGI